MSQLCVEDPLGTAKVCTALAAEVAQMGFAVNIGADARKFNATKIATLHKPVSPFFDPRRLQFHAGPVFLDECSFRKRGNCGSSGFQI